MHKLLTRQLSRLGLSETIFPSDFNLWQNFINLISKVYSDFDDERYLIERSMAVSSKEIMELNTNLISAQRIANLGYWTMNVESGKLRWSDELRSIRGLSSLDPDPNYAEFLKMIHPNDRKIIKNNIELCVATGKENAMEIRIRHTDGDYRWNYIIGGPLDQGNPPHKVLTGIAKDITQERAIRSQLEKTQAITTQFLAHIKLSFYQMSADGSKITFLNREIEKISGKPQKYFVGISQWLELVVAIDREKVKQYYLTQAESKISQSIEYKIERADGSIRNILDRCFVANDTTNNIAGLLGIIEDLTDINLKRRMESIFNNISNIFHKEDSLQSSVDGMLKKICQALEWPIGEVWLLDETKKQLYLFARYSATHVNSEITYSEPIVTVPANTRVFADIFKNDVLTYIRDQNQMWHKNYPLCVAARLVHNDEPLGMVNFFVNEGNDLLPEVTELLMHLFNEFSMYLQQQFVRDQYFMTSNYDAITGLYNHKFMIRSLKALIATQSDQPIVVIKILVDQIDKINQAYGAEIGNTLLKELTAFFLKNPHPNLHLMSSLDDHGFVFIFNNLNNFNAINSIVQLMLDVNKESFIIGGNNIAITVSVGVGIFPKDGINENVLLSSAKAALLKAHKSGGNCVIYATESINDELFQQVNIEFALHRALENNEFVLHYQPKVDFKTGNIIGAEALIRWQEPGGTLHMPGYFLDIAESTDLIIPIGEWVLREVCRQISVDDFGVPIAVNLSIRQFRTNNYFFDLVTRVIAEYGINPQMLEFEVTESIIISGNEIINDFMKFRNMGIHIAFDDFGTKYCSLSYLKNYIPDRMKIDKSFVDGIPSSATNTAIVKSTVSLAKSLNILLTVEGAESPEQVKFFIDLDCDDLQSYYISKAVPAAEFKKLLKNNYKARFDKLF